MARYQGESRTSTLFLGQYTYQEANAVTLLRTARGDMTGYMPVLHCAREKRATQEVRRRPRKDE